MICDVLDIRFNEILYFYYFFCLKIYNFNIELFFIKIELFILCFICICICCLFNGNKFLDIFGFLKDFYCKRKM